MTHSEIREKFLKFFESRGHKIVPSSSLLPTDPSVLFTTAGMQQFKPYYTGKADAMKDFGSLNIASIQKSMRTSDIDEVGDESHLTFFEMLGNFSFGGYWKKGAIEWAYEFITKEMGLEIDYVSVFEGLSSAEVPADDESEKIWKSLDSNMVVKKADIHDNFWGPTGSEGPCGPTTEIYVNGVEIWNIVFNEFYYHGSREELLSGTSLKKLEKLKTSGIDTGMGLERLAMVAQNKKNIFETDLFEPILKLVPSEINFKTKRIIADHSRTIAFLITDGVRPSNKEQGYVLRRLMRRIITYFYTTPVDNRLAKSVIHRMDLTLMHDLFVKMVRIYDPMYPELNADMVIREFDKEKERFEKTLEKGLKEFERRQSRGHFSGKDAYYLHETYGFPFIVTEDLIRIRNENFDFNKLGEEYDQASLIHKDISRAGAEKKFGGHGLLMDTGELKAGNEEELKKATRLHTATHLLHASLRKILGNEVHQAGSDITAERLRFDFTFPRKVTPEEIKQVEDVVNEAVQKDYKVTKEEMPYEDAIKSGAVAFFKLKYPNRVNVYTIGPDVNSPSAGSEQFFSKELCGGPHVSHTSEIGNFKITKEEAVSAGVRRIRATVN